MGFQPMAKNRAWSDTAVRKYDQRKWVDMRTNAYALIQRGTNRGNSALMESGMA
jgi:hypothetical protein